MKFGVREICDVVLKAKAAQKVGSKIFYKNEPVIYFDTLKTSSLEGAATTVYAQGGRGNPRLVAWEGERTVTFTMEDALISPEGLALLSGAGLIDASEKVVYQHMTEVIDKADLDLTNFASGEIKIPLSNKPYLPTSNGDNFAYVMFKEDGEIITEPYIPEHGEIANSAAVGEALKYVISIKDHANYVAQESYEDSEAGGHSYTKNSAETDSYEAGNYDVRQFPALLKFDSVLVDYYVARNSGATQMEITADKFGGNYYLEASTLFRNEAGEDMPAEFIIPNCKIQSNFTFTMASSGDPSTFTFTMDAFPDYTRFDHTHKVMAAIQVIQYEADDDLHRHSTPH